MSKKIDRINETALALEGIVALPKEDEFSQDNQDVKRAQLKNLSSAMSRYMAQDGRHLVMPTLTFGAVSRVDFSKITKKGILNSGRCQYNGLMAFLHKLRTSKKLKHDIRYFCVIEVQPEGGALHAHIAISLSGSSEVIALMEFLQDFKSRYTQTYQYNSRPAFPIDRSHFGVSSTLKKAFEEKYILEPHLAKSDLTRVEYYLPELDKRKFKSGSWTPLEFYTKTMMEDRYEEQITKYLVKSMDGTFELDNRTIQEGVCKCQLGHDTKTLHSKGYINALYLGFIRLIGQVYTHSLLPFPHKLYQQHRKALMAYNPNYKIYYNCIEDFQNNLLFINKGIITDSNNTIIAGATK